MAQLAAHPSVRAHFTQTRSSPALAQAQISSGQLVFVLGHGMLWYTEQPIQETLLLSGAHAARLDAQGRPQSIRNARGISQIAQMLQSLLAGQAEPVLREFDVQVTGDSDHWQLQLTPRQAGVANVLRTITLHGDHFLQGIRVTLQDGGDTDIQFSNARAAGALSATEQSALASP